MRIKYIIPIIGAFLFNGCHDDLDVVQTSQLSSSSMWTDQNDAISAMYGVHQQLRSTFSTSLAYWGEYRTGLWGPGNHKGLSQTVRDQVYQNNMPNTHSHADWENLYRTINLANLLLKYTPNISFTDEAKKNEVIANGHFARALSYYWIARIWGDAPLVLEGYESASQDLLPKRAPVSALYSQIEKDIESGLMLMPEKVNAKKTASQGALNILMADYALWMYSVENDGDSYLQKAELAITEVLSKGYSLSSNYAAIFETASEEGSEIIYAWNYAQDEFTGGYPSDYQFNSATVSSIYHFNPIAVGTGQQWTFYTDEYVDVLTVNPADTRLNTNYLTFYDNLMGQQFNWTNKYKGSWVNNTLILDSDIILYRLADAYLFNAEIKYHQKKISEAIQSVNRLVERAYGDSNYYSSGVSVSEVKDIIVKERMREFPAEGKLWWDFIRLDVVFEMNPYLVGREGDTNILLWPLSDKSINDNPNLGGQTPGWE